MIGAAGIMGLSPSEFWRLTPSEFFFISESWTESQGGITRRQVDAGRAKMAQLKNRYPDQVTPKT